MTAGHLGFKKTLERFQGRFYWEGMYADIKAYTRECMSCNKAKTPPIRRCAPLASYTRPKGPLDKVQVDIIGKIYPQSYSGMSVILVITDEFTKFAEAIALPDQKAQTVAQALVTQFFCKYGIPNTIHTDQGKNFMSGLLKEITQLLGIEKVIGTAYHPQSQGAVERCNRSLKEMLMHYVQEDPRQWDRFIPFVMQAYNTSPSATTLFTPYFLFFGREAKLPVDVLIDKPEPQYRGADDYKAEVAEKMYLAHKLASKNAEEARELQKRQYDKKAKIRHFAVGDQVYLTNEAVRSRRLKEGFSRKFAYPWKGPYRIVQQMSEVNFKIKEIGGSKIEVVHMNRLKLVPAGNLALEEKRMASKARRNESNRLKKKGNMGESETQNEDSDDELFEESRGEISVRDESDQDEDETDDDQVSDDLDEEEAEEDMLSGVDEDGTSVGRPYDEGSGVGGGDEVFDTENRETLTDEEEEKSEVEKGAISGNARGWREQDSTKESGGMKYPCGVCDDMIYDTGRYASSSIRCTRCRLWVHEKCSRFNDINKMTRDELVGYRCSRCLEKYGPFCKPPMPQRNSNLKGKSKTAGHSSLTMRKPMTSVSRKKWCDPSEENVVPTRLRSQTKKEFNNVMAEQHQKGTYSQRSDEVLYARGTVKEGVYRKVEKGSLHCRKKYSQSTLNDNRGKEKTNINNTNTKNIDATCRVEINLYKRGRVNNKVYARY